MDAGEPLMLCAEAASTFNLDTLDGSLKLECGLESGLGLKTASKLRVPIAVEQTESGMSSLARNDEKWQQMAVVRVV